MKNIRNEGDGIHFASNQNHQNAWQNRNIFTRSLKLKARGPGRPPGAQSSRVLCTTE